MNGVQMFAAALVCVVLAGSSPVLGRIYNDCDLARELVDRGMPRDQINDWICLVKAESSFDTGVVGGPNTDNTYDWGLFQINDGYWCENADFPGKGCNLRCAELIDEDIGNDVECSKYIFTIHGFQGWNGWKNQCQNGVPDMSFCFG